MPDAASVAVAAAFPDDEQGNDTCLKAFGRLVGALAHADPNTVLVTMDLARRAEDMPRLFVRFPGAMQSTYELKIELVEGTAQCCHLHNPEGCCDPNDCGPCCENCPTCPTLAKQRKEQDEMSASEAAS